MSIGGDRRTDSPGHSAKYGSHGIIDLDTDKIVHIELVQISVYFKATHSFLLYRAMKLCQVTIWRRKVYPGLFNF